MEVIRAFIAISLTGKVQEQLGKLIQFLYTNYPTSFIRWVPVNNIHLTLMFLGDVPQDRMNLLSQNLYQELASRHRFDISFGGLGVFPSVKKPNVLWVGIKFPPELKEIRDGIQARMENLGFERENRPFSPHLTIGRFRRNISLKNAEVTQQILQENSQNFKSCMPVESIHLFRSDLKPTGAVYSEIYSVNLES